MESNAFGRQLRRYRQALDLTQQQLGQRVGCADVTIRKIELGERRPSRQLAESLARHLNLSSAEKAEFIAAARAPAATNAPSQRRTTLPAHLAPLIGRDTEVMLARHMLQRDGVRLLTLTGPGGVGKTSLARAISHDLKHERQIIWVDLAEREAAHLVMPAVAHALGVTPDGNTTMLQQVADLLRESTALLVLDNFEHVQTAATQIAALLGHCPHLAVLSTSRMLLHIAGEQRLCVEPLPADMAQHLFSIRALEANPLLHLDDVMRASIAALCAHLDGLPLAIELVAARAALMSPQAMLAQFVAGGALRLSLVVNGASGLPERHHSLENAIQWSLNLLSPEDRAVFARLAVFVGDFALPAAVHVTCASKPPRHEPSETEQVATWNALTRLLHANLLTRAARAPGNPAPEPRFVLLESMREAARMELAHSTEADAVAERHAGYFARMAEDCTRDQRAIHASATTQLLRSEMPNLMAAATHAVGHNQAERACVLCAACGEVWQDYMFFAEGLALTERALALPAIQTGAYRGARAGALITLVRLSGETEAHARTLSHCEEALALYRAMDDARGAWMAMHQRAWQARRNSADGWSLHVALLDEVRQAGDAHWTAVKLADLAVMSCFDRADFDAAARYAADAVALFEMLDDAWGLRYALNTQGTALRHLGSFDAATEALARAGEIDDTASPIQLATLEYERGALCLARGEVLGAVDHYAAAAKLAMQIGSPLKQHMALANQGLAEIAAGFFDEAQGHLRRALTFFDASPAIASEQCFAAMCRIGLARIAASAGNKTDATALLRAADGVTVAHPEAFDARVREMLDETRRLVG